MILGLDPGTASCGWALLDPRERKILDLGVVIQPRRPGKALNEDRVGRAMALACDLAEITRGVELLVVEAMSFPPGGSGAITPIALGMGLTLGVSAAIPEAPSVLQVSPQRWQRAIVPEAGRKIPYATVTARVIAYLETTSPDAYRRLLAIAGAHRNHAIDAVGLALMGAFRPRECKPIARPGETKRVKRLASLRVLQHDAAGASVGWSPLEGLPPGGRAECRDGPRPCPRVKCTHHLWRIDGPDRQGPHRADRTPLGTTIAPRWLETPTPPTCELDVAKTVDPGKPDYKLIGHAIDKSADWARRLVTRALDGLRAAHPELAEELAP